MCVYVYIYVYIYIYIYIYVYIAMTNSSIFIELEYSWERRGAEQMRLEIICPPLILVAFSILFVQNYY